MHKALPCFTDRRCPSARMGLDQDLYEVTVVAEGLGGRAVRRAADEKGADVLGRCCLLKDGAALRP
jgi:hypothetical protein